MKKRNILLSTTLAATLLLTGCLKEKEIPAEQLITIYNSNMQKTLKMHPAETMYVQIAGLEANAFHEIDVLDPDGNLITKAQAMSNEEGVIERFPVWYEVGLRKPDEDHKDYYIDDSKELGLRSFYIKVKSLDNDKTNFKQDFFIITTQPKKEDMPRAIVESMADEKGDGNYTIENTFLETGSKTVEGEDSNLTKVYVKATKLPFYNDEHEDYDSVDIYIVPFLGSNYPDKFDLESNSIVKISDVPVKEDGDTKTIDPTLIWDMNSYPKLINPGNGNNAYSIFIDINKNGIFDIGQDLNDDGVTDKYIDGIDGQGSAGFIVLNTEANDVDKSVKIVDENNQTLNSIPEHEANKKIDLYFYLKNLPTDKTEARLFVIDKDTIDLEDGTDLSDLDQRQGGSQDINITHPDDNETYPYIYTKFLNTADDDFSYQKDISDVKPLDVVIDMNKNDTYDKGIDYFFPNITDILPVETNLTTTVDADGEKNSTIFNESYSDQNTTVYLLFGNKKDDSASGDEHEIYVFKHQDWQKGDYLGGELFRTYASTADGSFLKLIDFNMTNKDDDSLLNYELMNPKSTNNKFDIIVDKDDDNEFSDDDKILTITVRDTKANDLANVSYINIASGGKNDAMIWVDHWGNSPNVNTYDYRDVFDTQASGTQWACCGRYSTGWGRGIKAIWNPYIKDKGWFHRKDGNYTDEKGEERKSPFNNGQWVDLYIVDANTFKLVKDADLNDSVDVRGRKQTMPIQFSCRNGLWQQNIWSPANSWRNRNYSPIKVGKYYVIVDVNRDGKLTEGVDFVDAVNKEGKTIKDDRKIVGFSVVE